MNLEHVALNVSDPAAAADWYCKNLGMTIARQFGPPVNCRFIRDKRGKMMIEFYCNPGGAVPDYRSIHPLTLHIAFSVENVAATRASLIAAGATPEGEIVTNDDGDQIANLRDPWGLTVQILTRTQPMV